MTTNAIEWLNKRGHKTIFDNSGKTSKGLDKIEFLSEQIYVRSRFNVEDMARILRRVLETCCLSNFIERPSANTFVKNS